MPPSKKGKAVAAVASADPHEVLAAQCARTQLEALVLASLRSGEPVTFEKLELASKGPGPAAVVEIQHGNALEGAGLFSCLPIDVLVKIVDYFHILPEKLTFVIEVCKGLRALRKEDAVWHRIDTSLRSHYGMHSHYETILWINGRGINRLAQWLPDASKTHELALHCSKGLQTFAPQDVSEVLARFQNVQRLRVTGQAITKKVLLDLAKHVRPALRHLSLEWGTVGPPTVLAVLKTMPQLVSLESTSLNRSVVEGLAQQLREARHGGAPLLTRLKETSKYKGGGMQLTAVDGMALGKLFPELRDLTLAFAMPNAGVDQLPTQPLSGANLRRLHIFNMIDAFQSLEHEAYSARNHTGAGTFLTLCFLL